MPCSAMFSMLVQKSINSWHIVFHVDFRQQAVVAVAGAAVVCETTLKEIIKVKNQDDDDDEKTK